MAHSSGASRLALPQRAVQPGGGGALAAFALSAGAAAGDVGAVCADLGGALDFAGCCAPTDPVRPETASAAMRMASFAEFFITRFINPEIGQQIGQVSLIVKNNLYQSMA